MKTISKGGFLGINNRLPDFALKVRSRQTQGDFLREAVNVDVDNAGRLRRREAFARIQPLTAPHSLYMTSDTDGYFVMANTLYAVTLPSYTATFVKLLTSNDPVSYAEFAGSIYYSNGTDSGRLLNGTYFPWALPTPVAPGVAGGIGGSLLEGWYQVAVCHRNSVTGEEGGVSPSSNYNLTSVGGLRVTLPAATTGANLIDVYVSTSNGSVPFLAATVAAGTASVDIVDETTRGREANQRYEAPLPAGRPFLFNGVLCSINGANVYEGIPYRPGYYLPAEGRIPFPATVSNVIPAQFGVYVVADQTYWIPGTHLTSSKDVIKDVLPYGGVTDTAFSYGDNDNVRYGWFGKYGIVLADTNGAVSAVMYDNVDLTPPASGVSKVFTDRGYLRVVSCGWCLNLENKAATRYVGYDFTSVSGAYGTKADGIYVLSATGKVDSLVNLGKEDFGTENKKVLPAIYLGAQSETPMVVTVTTPGDGSYDYTARSCNGDDLELHRVEPGKGLLATWYDLTITNTDGADFTLASASFAPAASTRRI